MANKSEGFQKRSLMRSVYLPSLLFAGAEGAMLPILPVSAVLLGFSLAEAAIVATVLMIGTLVFEVPASKINTVIGERNSMLVATTIGAGLTVLAFFNLGYLALLLTALGFGAMYSLFGLARH